MHNHKKTRLAALALLALAAAPAANAQSAPEEGWQWVAAPYLWMSSIGTDLREDAEPVPSQTSFSDVVSKLDMAFQMHVEGQGDRFGVLADVTYIALSDERDNNVFGTDAALDTTITEVAGVWNVSPERYEGLDVIFGVRHINADLSVAFESNGPPFPATTVGFDQSYTDAMVGVRYSAKLSEKWGLIGRLDGGFGDTDGTTNASVMLTRKMSKGSLVLGYRYMNLELGDNGRSVDVTMQGPMLAFAFGL